MKTFLYKQFLSYEVNKFVAMRKTIKCVVVDCPNRTDNKYSKEISFHGFPLDPIRKAEWVAAINRKNWKPSTQSILCSEHFQPEDLDRTSQYVRLHNNAIPSIFSHKQQAASEAKASPMKNRLHKQTVILEYESSGEGSLELEVFPEELSDAQLKFRERIENELAELERLSNLQNVEVIYEKKVPSSDVLTNISSDDRKRKRSDVSLELNDNPSSGCKSVTDTKSASAISSSSKTTRRVRKPPTAKNPKPKDPLFNESRAIGGLTAVFPPITPNNDSVVSTFRRIESNEKLNVSLLVVAKPHLRAKEFIENDLMQLDIRFKTILSYVPKEFTEWLFKQGLLRSYQNCICHPSVELKLYNDLIRFPDSGGYTWISDCCPDKIVSVYNGSLFESLPYIPSEILKLIYHWSCQTNFKNMVGLVKVDHSHTTLMYSWLRAICTVTVQTHFDLFGGRGKKVEVGVITLTGMQLPNSKNRPKVEVLGVLEVETQNIRLRALELSNSRRKFTSNILEQLSHWIHPESIIAIDETIDKNNLIKRGFADVQQSTSGDHSSLNASIKSYLLIVLSQMFENSVSLLTNNVIQQFLDELVWRERYGTTPAEAFDNIMLHISEQTHIDTSITNRLAQVLANPVKDWKLKV